MLLRNPFVRQHYSRSEMAFIDEANREVEYTWDEWRLSRYEWQRLFIPDEMQRGYYRYPLIAEKSYFAYRAFTEESFTLWKKKLGAATYAIALPEAKYNIPLAHIGGQVHIVRSEVFKELDKLKLNGVHFERKRVSVLIPFREQVTGRAAGHERVRRKYCHMYVGIPDYWNQQLDGGYYFSPCRRIENPHSKFVSDYYLFSKLEYAQQSS